MNDLPKLDDLTFIDPDGNEVKLSSFRGQPLLLVFLRHLV